MDIPPFEQYVHVERLSSDQSSGALILNVSDELFEIIIRIGKEMSQEIDYVIKLDQIPQIIKEVVHRVDMALPVDLDINTRIECVTGVLFYIIDETVTEDFPDIIFDPVFKCTIQIVTAILLPSKEFTKKYSYAFNDPILDTKITREHIHAIGDRIIGYLGGAYIHLSILHDILALTIKVANTMVNINPQERELVAIAIFEYIIDQTDFILIPDFIFDPLIKQLYKHIIPVLL